MSQDTFPNSFAYVPFWGRVGAGTLDLVLCLPWFWIHHWCQQAAFRLWSPAPLLALQVIGFAVWVACISRFGATPGKLLLGMRIVDSKGNTLSLERAGLRNLDYLLSIALSVLDYGEIFAAAPPAPRPQSWSAMGDYLLAHETIYAQAQHWWIVYFLADFLVVATNSKKRALHDYIAGSYVVTKKSLLKEAI